MRKNKDKKRTVNNPEEGVLDTTCCDLPDEDSLPTKQTLLNMSRFLEPKSKYHIEQNFELKNQAITRQKPKAYFFPLSSYSKEPPTCEIIYEEKEKKKEKVKEVEKICFNAQPSKKSKKPFIPLELIEDGYFDGSVSNQKLQLPPLEIMDPGETTSKKLGMRGSTKMMSSVNSSKIPAMGRNIKKMSQEQSKSNLKINFDIGNSEDGDISDLDNFDF